MSGPAPWDFLPPECDECKRIWAWEGDLCERHHMDFSLLKCAILDNLSVSNEAKIDWLTNWVSDPDGIIGLLETLVKIKAGE